MFAFLPLSLVMAAFDNLAWSVAAAYRSISFSVRCPEMAAISFADDPLSARRRMIALRRPCGTQRAGRPASSTAFFMSRVNVGRRMRRPLASPISVAPLAGEALIAARNTLVEQSGTFTIVVDFLDSSRLALHELQRMFRVFGRVSCPNRVNERYQDRQSYLPVAVPVAAGCIGQFKGLSRSYPTRLPLGEVGKNGDN